MNLALRIGVPSFIVGLLISALMVSTAYASDLASLVQDLAGDDEAKRVIARQLLPREGARAVPSLLKLMEHDDPGVWRAAKNVLADIGHSVGTPGREKERRQFTRQLIDVLHSNAPDWTIKHAIRLLGIVAPEGYSIKPLREFARDSKWREETLGALAVMGTPESRKMLEQLSHDGTVEARVEVIEVLRLVSGKVPAKLLRDSDPRIRVAAMRALASSGSQKLTKPFEYALRGIKGALRVEAVDAYLNLAEAVARTDETRAAAVAMFRHILTTEKATAQRGAALAGLGRYGDHAVVATILEATQGPQGHDLEASALMALGDLHTQAAYAALLEAFPSVGEEMQLGLLGVFGRSQDSLFRNLLDAAAKASNPAKQSAAKQALKQFHLPPNINPAEASHPPKEEESTN